MRKLAVSIRLAALAVAAGSVWIAYTQNPQPEALELQHVKGPLHTILGSGGNTSVLVTEEGIVLGDDKFDRNVPAILEKVRSLSDKPLRFVLNTHHHGDHTGGNAKLFGEGAELVAHENARAHMVRDGQPGPQAITFSEQLSVHVGGTEVRLLYFGPGHTNGDVILYFPQLRTIHTGDLFVSGAPFIDYAHGGSAIQWDDTLNSILQLEFDTVIPGHGPVTTREAMVQWKEDFDTFRNRVGDLSRAGKSKEEAIAEVKLDDLDGWTVNNRMQNGMEGLLREMR